MLGCGVWSGGGLGGQGGCERRIEVFLNIKKKTHFLSGGGGWVGWVDLVWGSWWMCTQN